MDGKNALRARMAQPGPLLVMGAHNGISARLASEAGFDAIWASGFEISASHGVPDANILTMTDNLLAARQMVSAGLPVIADCDNGYGNAINVIHMVRAYESEGIAAVCIEDNIFPKRCSFYAGVARELSPIDEHAGKIKACLDTRRSNDFQIIARTEALIAGWGMEEALKRGRAYADAGADMVLIHSKSKDAKEVLEFARLWDREVPLVCVPTIYKKATADELAKGGFKVVIYANHGLRASIMAMRSTFSTIRKEQHCSSVDDRVVPLDDVYALIGVSQMKSDEKAYLPAGGAPVGAIVLAAAPSPELGDLTADRPKAMLDIKGKSLLQRQVEALNDAGIKEISVVAGWKKEAIDLPNLKLYDGTQSEGELASLMRAEAELKRRTLVLYGDILFDGEVVKRLLQTEGDVVLVVDRTASTRPRRDLVHTTNGIADQGRMLAGQRMDTLDRIGVDLADANGEWIGMLMLTAKGSAALIAAYQKAAKAGAEKPLHQAPSLAKASLTDMLQALRDEGIPIHTIDTYKGWMEVDTFEDYRRAWNLVH